MEIITEMLIAGVFTGALGSIVVQAIKKNVPKKWRSLFAIGVTIAVSLLSVGVAALIGWNAGEVIGWEYVSALLLSAVAISQTTYAAVVRVVPEANQLDFSPIHKIIAKIFGKSENIEK